MISKGIVLAGGLGTRLRPMTLITNKHLLPVYDKPMVFYPINTLLKAGIKDIMVVTGCEHMGQMINILKSGKEFGCKFSYAVQEEAGGIAQALGLCEDFANGESVAVILGDNIFEEKFDSKPFDSGARIYLKKVPDPKRFGVPVFNDGKIIAIEEKPNKPKTDYAVTGLYLYENSVFDVIKTLKPSGRGELEITDVNNHFIAEGKMDYEIFDGFWSDAGTPDSLLKSSNFVKENNEYF